mmetsp:Transcript_3621/g.7354  ORF Transcript_3621/g.7354 Transcript_3621/m.7354 type:complete len:406 (-) Transcript_3621:348-1565(-)
MEISPQGDMGNGASKKGRKGGRQNHQTEKPAQMEVEPNAREEKHQRPKRSNKFHVFESNGIKYRVPENYQFKRKLGQGAYGSVCKVVDVSLSPPTDFAIKRCDQMFGGSMTDAKRILREVKILRHLNHDNIIKLHDLFGPEDTKEDFQTVYIVMEFMQTDLRRVIYSRNELGNDHVQCITYQILMGLKYLHSAKIWHRDLKPANILLNSDCTVKICDFGLSRGFDGAIDQTDYVVTRWYRAPEVMCSNKYGAGIDLWATGCIMAELHGRKPLFKGENYKDQVCEIIRIMGVPSKEDFDAVIQNQHAHRYVKRYLTGLSDTKGTTLKELYPKASQEALDLMGKLLKFNPSKRATVAQGLEHPFFKEIREPEAETTCSRIFDWGYEKTTQTKIRLQEEFRAEFKHWK